jgi:hypothetical protein
MGMGKSQKTVKQCFFHFMVYERYLNLDFFLMWPDK